MLNQITVTFEELPAFSINGADCGLTDGTAIIGFDDDGNWDVDEIHVDAFGPRRRSEPLSIIEHQAVYCCLLEAIKDRMARHIEDEINDWFASQADTVAEQRRELMAAE
jgi:hypothetical protein